MSEPAVRIAVSIKDRVARQLACNLFSAAGATVQVYEGVAAIPEADEIQAVVLGLGAAPEETFDALVILRQRFGKIPIYVIADAAGERHAKRATSFGATQVVSHDLLPRRVGHLVQQIGPSSGTSGGSSGGMNDLRSQSPGWAGAKGDPGYELQSMDLGAWLAIPANRRSLGMAEPFVAPAPSAVGSAPKDASPGAAPPSAAPAPPVSFASVIEVMRAQKSPGTEPHRVAPGVESPAPCGLTDECPQLVHCRAQHDAQNAAILEAHQQRDKRINELNQKFRDRLQIEVKSELTDATALQVAAALQRTHLMLGVLAGVVVLQGLALAWHWLGW